MRYEVYGKGVRGERREARGERKEMRGGATPPPSCAHVRPSSEALLLLIYLHTYLRTSFACPRTPIE